MLELRGTGGDEIRTVLVQPKRLALFAYLTLATPRRLHRRDSLFALFWPEADIEQARRSLRQSLHFLKQALGSSVLVRRGDEEVGVQPDALWCDVHEFERALDAGQAAEALTLYSGHLLEGFHVAGVAPEFEQWLEEERARLRARAITAAISLRDAAQRTGNTSLASQYARDVLRLDWASEGALRCLMTLLDHSGDRAAALRTYDEFCRRLAVELDAQPSAELAALAEQLRHESRALSNDNAIDFADRVPTPNGSPLPNDKSPDQRVLQPPAGQMPRHVRWSRRETLMAIATGALVVTVVALMARPTTESSDTDNQVPVHRQLTFDGNVSLSAISPDGRSLAYLTEELLSESEQAPARLLVRDVDGGPALELARLESRAVSLAWFPDGASVLITGNWGARRYPRLGGAPQVLSAGAITTLSPDGSRLATLAPASRIRFRDLRAGDTTSMTIPGSSDYVRRISWSPNGGLVAVLTWPGTRNSALWTLNVRDKDTALVVPPTEGPVDAWTWASSGDAIYTVVKDQLWRIPIDVRTGERGGPARLLLSNIPINSHDLRNALSVAASGDRLAYTKLQSHSNVWVATDSVLRGNVSGMRQLTTGTGLKVHLALSPDHQRAAFIELAGAGADVYTIRVTRGPPERVTFIGTVTEGGLAWSPTGASLAFLATVGGERRVAIVAADGASAPRILSKRAGSQIAWSPDGRIAYQALGNRNFILFDPQRGTEQRLVANDSVGWMFDPQFAPDGNRVVIRWNRADGRGLWIVSLVDGSQQLLRHSAYSDRVLGWTRDGSALFIEAADRSLRRVSVTSGAATVFAIAPPASDCRPMERSPGIGFVCAISELTADAWMVEHFDPAVRARQK